MRCPRQRGGGVWGGHACGDMFFPRSAPTARENSPVAPPGAGPVIHCGLRAQPHLALRGWGRSCLFAICRCTLRPFRPPPSATGGLPRRCSPCKTGILRACPRAHTPRRKTCRVLPRRGRGQLAGQKAGESQNAMGEAEMKSFDSWHCASLALDFPAARRSCEATRSSWEVGIGAMEGSEFNTGAMEGSGFNTGALEGS
jgi:hypothetical protein